MTGAALQGLHTAVLGRRAIYLEETDSTNRYLKEAGESLPHGTLCYTGRQTSGRGRLGRDWTAPDGAALAMSVLLRGAADADWSGLPLVCGIAVAAALDRLAGERAGMLFRIKWPNDIICAGRKMCGILCESSQGETGRFAVAGIGVNLTQTEADFRGAGLPHAGSVRMLTGISLSLGETAAAILNELEALWDLYAREGFASLRGPYEERCITLGREVRLLSPDGGFLAAGRAAGLAEDGGLIVDTAAGRSIYRSGEVSVRGVYDYV